MSVVPLASHVGKAYVMGVDEINCQEPGLGLAHFGSTFRQPLAGLGRGFGVLCKAIQWRAGYVPPGLEIGKAEVLVDGDEFRVIRKRPDYDSIIALDIPWDAAG